MSLSKVQIEHYREFGWVAPVDIMSEDEAAYYLSRLEQAELDYPGQFSARYRNNAHISFPFMADIAFNKKIVSAAASLVGENMSLLGTVLFAKEPKSSSYVSWHQDATYMGLASNNLTTGWLALTHSNLENGCVAVIPKTHHQGMVKHNDTFGEDNILTRGQEVADIDKSTAVNLILRPGQMSFHGPWLVHGSLPNNSDSRRIGLALQSYLGDDVKPARGEHHVMHIQGAPVSNDFIEVPRPTETYSEENRLARDKANDAFADVLYEGAKMKRNM